MLNSSMYNHKELSKIPSTRGIYAAWLGNECIYVGKSSKLNHRLKSHYSGQRGSDQFCLYIFDSYIKVIPNEVGANLSKHLNLKTQKWIRENLSFSYFECENDTVQETFYRKSMHPTLNTL